MLQPVIGYDLVDGEVHERLGEAEIARWTEANDDHRAHAWRRLLMYLAGHEQAASLSRLPIENAAVLHAVLLPAATNPERGPWLNRWGCLVPPRRLPLEREPATAQRGRALRTHLDAVEDRSEAIWSEVWWTKPGSTTRHDYSRLRLPDGTRQRRGTVRRQLLAAERAARAWWRRG